MRPVEQDAHWIADCLLCREWTSRPSRLATFAKSRWADHLRLDHDPEGRIGTVFVAWVEEGLEGGDDGFYMGYWDGHDPVHDEGFLGQMPATADLDLVLEWADARSDRIRIRPSWDPATYYEAGRRAHPGAPILRKP
jgi:hypothetical protein